MIMDVDTLMKDLCLNHNDNHLKRQIIDLPKGENYDWSKGLVSMKLSLISQILFISSKFAFSV